jgi:hypothetical protein
MTTPKEFAEIFAQKEGQEPTAFSPPPPGPLDGQNAAGSTLMGTSLAEKLEAALEAAPQGRP